jgi:hypothetical protein
MPWLMRCCYVRFRHEKSGDPQTSQVALRMQLSVHYDRTVPVWTLYLRGRVHCNGCTRCVSGFCANMAITPTLHLLQLHIVSA